MLFKALRYTEQDATIGVQPGMRHVRGAAIAFAALITISCGPVVDLTSGLRVEGVATGWYEASASESQIKLVPAVSFTLKNLSDQKLGTLQVNAVFRRIDQDDEWASGFLTAAGSAGLPPGAATGMLFVPSPLGYTGTESRFEMLKNSHFVDAKVQLFAKYASTKWVPVGEFPIARQLIER